MPLFSLLLLFINLYFSITFYQTWWWYCLFMTNTIINQFEVWKNMIYCHLKLNAKIKIKGSICLKLIIFAPIWDRTVLQCQHQVCRFSCTVELWYSNVHGLARLLCWGVVKMDTIRMLEKVLPLIFSPLRFPQCSWHKILLRTFLSHK